MINFQQANNNSATEGTRKAGSILIYDGIDYKI